MQAKKSSSNIQAGNENGPPRKRAALGDVSNVNKGDIVEVKEGKKALNTTAGLLSKAAQPAGIQKASRTNSTRSILGPRDKNLAGNELKRPASVTGVAGNVPKRRTTSSMSGRRSGRDEVEELENKNPSANETVKLHITETEKVVSKTASGDIVEQLFKHDETFELNQEHRENSRIAEQIESMDAEDYGDPLMVSEYVYEILDYMKDLECTTMPNANYMDHQKDLEWRMRGVLIDWLLEVHTRFHLLPETFYLTVNIIDRFLSSKVVQLERLQLVGVTAMFIASKYEEVLSPHIGNFRHVADDGFTEAEILSAERFILQTLDYNLSFPNPMHFMRRISKADNYDIQSRTLAKYLLEISLLDHRFLEFRPSVNAAASMHLARIILEKGPWDDILVHYSGYTEEEIEPAFDTMIDYLRGPVAHNAFYKKYAGKKFLKGKFHTP